MYQVKYSIDNITYTFYEGHGYYQGLFVSYIENGNLFIKYLPMTNRLKIINKYKRFELLPSSTEAAKTLLSLPTSAVCNGRKYYDTWRTCFTESQLIEFLIKNGADARRIEKVWKRRYESITDIGWGSTIFSFSFPNYQNKLLNTEIGRVFQRHNSECYREWFVINNVIEAI